MSKKKFRLYAIVHGYYERIIEAETLDEASELFLDEIMDADFGDLTDVDWETRVDDSTTNITDDNEDETE